MVNTTKHPRRALAEIRPKLTDREQHTVAREAYKHTLKMTTLERGPISQRVRDQLRENNLKDSNNSNKTCNTMPMTSRQGSIMGLANSIPMPRIHRDSQLSINQRRTPVQSKRKRKISSTRSSPSHRSKVQDLISTLEGANPK
jgi:hypothetical protein